jgi:alkyl hydroperoxide reductase subunit AhpC
MASRLALAAPRLLQAARGAVQRGMRAAVAPRRFMSSEPGSDISLDDYSLYNEGILYPPPTVRIGQRAPDFSGKAVVGGQITDLSRNTYNGRWVVLLFYPKDFTFVCPTEIIAFSDRVAEFHSLHAEVIAVSTDTEECHLAWTHMPRKKGGLGEMAIPLLADTTKAITNSYGVLIEEAGIALRGLFLINPEGMVEQMTVNNLPVGRSVDETLRLLRAFQFTREHGEVCPANWQPGSKTMVPDPIKSQAYFASGATEKK